MEPLNSWLITLAIALFRLVGVSLMFPPLAGSGLWTPFLRGGVLVALTLPVLPVLHSQGYAAHLTSLQGWLSITPGEVIVGLLLGFCTAIPFWAVDMAGFLIDTLRGSTMASAFNPSIGGQTSVFGLLFSQFLCAVFFISGGMDQILTVLYDSYRFLPPGHVLLFNQQFLRFILSEWHMLSRLCLSFSLPTVIIMVLVDLALGLLNRSAQQLNVFFLSMPIKSALALLVLLMSLPHAFHHYLAVTDRLYIHLNNWFASHE